MSIWINATGQQLPHEELLLDLWPEASPGSGYPIPATGERLPGFGDNGIVDMTPKEIERGYLGVTVPGVVFEDQLIMGFSRLLC